jgi:hypothetical protein
LRICWEVTVRIKQTEDGPFSGNGDFTEKLPE